ncbi:MAG: hypothetical protein KJZ92_13295 [Rhodocyclaceae bacterium]|nr:hypothetical protein [Rhodocyclaceae bacterium]
MIRHLLLLAFLALAGFGGYQAIAADQQITQVFGYEDEDFGVSPTTVPKQAPYHANTPLDIPGGKRILTLELKRMLEGESKPIVIDVLGSKERNTLQGAFWMKGAGDGNFFGAEKSRFSTALQTITGGDKNRPVVFLCFDRQCWLSYNAALHAMEAGYKNVYWYRGGTRAWEGASLKTEKAQPYNW